VVHPLVLLSVADHHARSALRSVARGSSKRVVGVLLGQDSGIGKSINVANSFGVPFEEDDKDAKTWFLDHNYVEGMFEMFKKVNGAYCVSALQFDERSIPDHPHRRCCNRFQRGNA
jgi:26S proteasome regulatory subunit N8